MPCCSLPCDRHYLPSWSSWSPSELGIILSPSLFGLSNLIFTLSQSWSVSATSSSLHHLLPLLITSTNHHQHRLSPALASLMCYHLLSFFKQFWESPAPPSPSSSPAPAPASSLLGLGNIVFITSSPFHLFFLASVRDAAFSSFLPIEHRGTTNSSQHHYLCCFSIRNLSSLSLGLHHLPPVFLSLGQHQQQPSLLPTTSNCISSDLPTASTSVLLLRSLLFGWVAVSVMLLEVPSLPLFLHQTQKPPFFSFEGK